jgi:hypothetical protein
MMRQFPFWILALILLLVVVDSSRMFQGVAANQKDFLNANNLIISAYVDLHTAEQQGGNVSSLVVQLNAALSLYEKAQQENLTNPNQATIDLTNASQIASNVTTEYVQLGQASASVRIAQQTNAEVESTLVIIGAALVYVFGPIIYRRLWLYVYRDFLVKAQNNG